MAFCASEGGVILAAEKALARANSRTVYAPSCHYCSSSNSSRKRPWEGALTAEATELWETNLQQQKIKQEKHQQQHRAAWHVGDSIVAAAELLFDAQTLYDYRYNVVRLVPLLVLRLLLLLLPSLVLPLFSLLLFSVYLEVIS